jgi:hypothetical protein
MNACRSGVRHDGLADSGGKVKHKGKKAKNAAKH